MDIQTFMCVFWMIERQLYGADLWKGGEVDMDQRGGGESQGQRDLGLPLEMEGKHSW